MQKFIDIILALTKAYVDQAILDAKVIPPGTIIGWWGLWAACPDGWVICDGHAEGPNLMAKFMRSSGSGIGVMSFGGDNEHIHAGEEDHHHELIAGTGLRGGSLKTANTGPPLDTGYTGPASDVPEYVAMWWIMKL